MPALTAPQSTAVDFGTVMARAQQAAATQSATILSAANNISRGRERAGQAASDAVFRMRLESFQREQFAQKVKVENARVAIQNDANQRANELQPFSLRSADLGNQLKEVAINDAPLRTALLGTQLTGANIANAAGATQLGALEPRLRTEQEILESKGSILSDEESLSGPQTELKLNLIDQENDIFDQRADALSELNAIAASQDGSIASQTRTIAALDRLRKDQGFAISTDRKLTQIYNDALGRTGLGDDLRIEFDDGRSTPTSPPGFEITGFQQSTSADGRTSSNAQFKRIDTNDRPSQTEINRRIDAVTANSEAQAATFERELKSVNDDISALNKRMTLKGTKSNERATIQAKLPELRGRRQALENDLRGLEGKTAKEVEQLINLGSEDQFPGGLPSVSPSGPSTSIVGSPNEFTNAIP